LDGFANSFPQGIPNHTLVGHWWYTPPNHKSADLARAEIGDNLAKKVMARRMFGPFTHEEVARRLDFFRISPLGTAINSNGTVRPINNLSFLYKKKGLPSVNSFVEKEDFKTTWDDFKAVRRFLKRNTYKYLLGLFDWEKAYRQILSGRISYVMWPEWIHQAGSAGNS
jgi:hypothetical protein